MGRRGVVLLVLGTVLLSSGTTWVATALIRSPAEVAARTAPPDPSPILVPVEEKVLSSKVVTRGTGQYSSPRKLSITTSSLKSGPQVVTQLPEVGSVVSETDLLLRISGRPIFVLKGAVPSYRDLGPGMTGDDVVQLERALRRNGFDPGPVDGTYDASTERAVAALYRVHGFEPLVADEEQLAATRSVEAALVRGGRAGAGVQLPADEVVFAPRVPVRVTAVAANIGSPPENELVTVADLVVVVNGLVRVEQAELVEVGAQVDIDEPSLGISARGLVSRVAVRPGTNGADAFHTFFEVRVDDPPRSLVGSSVRLSIPVESTKGRTLTVPVSALSLSPDGGSRVQLSLDGVTSYVPVELGLSADGFVAVTSKAGALHAGDLVVIGFETLQSSGG